MVGECHLLSMVSVFGIWRTLKISLKIRIYVLL